MEINAELLRGLLVVVILGMALLALVYLQGRRLGAWQQVGWGLLILLLPLLGPFLVIWARPGERLT
jgi:hypothetical protein